MKRPGKVGRNELCPCGSGRKYKKCHLDRAAAKPVPYHESAKELLRLRVGEQKCLYQSPGNVHCSGKVIEAHSISRNAALIKIARDHKVYQIDANPFTIAKAEGEPQLKLEYIRSASTFTGFCSSHDSSLFRPIDQGGITPTREQAFLLHYRSLCREIYVKRPTLETNELLREADRGKPVAFQRAVQGLVSARSLSIKDALQQLEKDKTTCDNALQAQDFGILQIAFVRFREVPDLACAGYTQPTFDFAGNEIQDITDMSTPFLNLSFTLLPDEMGGVAVFSWLPDADTATTTDVYMQEIPASVQSTINSINSELRKSDMPSRKKSKESASTGAVVKSRRKPSARATQIDTKSWKGGSAPLPAYA